MINLLLFSLGKESPYMNWKKLAPLMIGVLTVTLWFFALSRLQYFRYENSDDIFFVKSFLGYEGGVPAGFNLYTHTLFARPLQWLSVLVPGIAWFSVLQLGLLWLSQVVICKSLMQCAQSNRVPLWVGWGAGMAFIAVFCLFPTCRLSYTTTSALAGTAAIAQLFSLPTEAGVVGWKKTLSFLLSVLMLICCYSLRQWTSVPLALFWGMALMALFPRLSQPWNRKPLWIALSIGLFLFAALIFLREMEIDTLQQRDFLAWQNARIRLMDYHEPAFDLVTDAQLKEIGWSRAELSMVRGWYFMDQNITTDALNRLSQIHVDASRFPFGVKLWSSVKAVGNFMISYPAYLLSSALLLLLGLVCILLAWTKEKRRWFPVVSALGTLGLMAALLVYLPWQGRLLPRAADCVLFPAALVLLGSAVSHAKLPSARAKGPWLVLCLLSVALCAGSGFITYRQLQSSPDKVSPTRQAALESFGLAHPEQLILYDSNLLRDTRLFPDVSQGIPINLMIWGDWYCRTPSCLFQLAQFGIDGAAFSPQDFLRDNVLFASASEDLPPALLPYLSEIGGNVTPRLYAQEGGLRFYQFTLKEESFLGTP